MIAKAPMKSSRTTEKRVLVVVNFEKTGLGLVGEALHAEGIGVVGVNASQGAPLPQTHAEFGGIVILGGAQNAIDDAISPWFPSLLRLTRDFVASGKPVLGICLGAQLLARALGGQNRIGGHTEFGWSDVSLTSEAAEDPLFAGLPERFPAFQWHDDHLTPPSGAVTLATNAVAPFQAFRFGRAAYGLQFHVEADTKLVQQWNTDFRSHLETNKPDWARRHLRDERAYGAMADAAGRKIAAGWTALL
jgi:GMP synthase-like glutamine amidotransferase